MRSRLTALSIEALEEALVSGDSFDAEYRVLAPEGTWRRVVARDRPELDLQESRAIEAGFQRHLANPVEPAELVRLAAELVSRKV